MNHTEMMAAIYDLIKRVRILEREVERLKEEHAKLEPDD